jgi:hypothetical protein
LISLLKKPRIYIRGCFSLVETTSKNLPVEEDEPIAIQSAGKLLTKAGANVIASG